MENDMKKIFSVMICMAMVLSFCACSDDVSVPELSISEVLTSVSEVSETSETSVSLSEEPEVSEEEPTPEVVDSTALDPHSEKELFEIYMPLFRDAYNCLFFGMTTMHDGFSGLLSEAMYMPDLEVKSMVGYCYLDIDKNGTKELIIGSEDVNYALCGYDEEEKPSVIFGAGYRAFLDICEDGTICYGGSSGAASQSTGFYKLDGKGGAELVDFYFTEASEGSDELAYYHDKTGMSDVTKAEVMTEEDYENSVSHEAMDLSSEFTSLIGFADLFGGTDSGVDPATLGKNTWVLDHYIVDDETINAADEGKYQTLTFNDNETVDYHCESAGEVLADKKGIQYFYYDFNGSMDIYIDNAGDGNNYTITLIRTSDDGMLVAQKLYYASDRYGVCYEYYKAEGKGEE